MMVSHVLPPPGTGAWCSSPKKVFVLCHPVRGMQQMQQTSVRKAEDSSTRSSKQPDADV